MTDAELDAAMAELEKELNEISSSSDEEEQEKHDNNSNIETDNNMKSIEIKKVIKLDEDELKQKRTVEIEEKAKLVDQALNVFEDKPNDKTDDDFDIESLDLEWKYSNPTIH